MQGFNMGRYHAPASLDPSLNSSKNPRDPPKISRQRNGAPVVRFEMPFAIWCSTCPAHSPNNLIGQGVRFNAEKRRVGNYLSTPVWAFRMKHTACGGWLEIRTDPKNSEYVVTEGAKRRDIGDNEIVAARTGGIVLSVEDEAEKKRQDAFAALENKLEDRNRAKTEAVRLEELRSLKERDWRNLDDANAKLRREFRVGRKEREKAEQKTGVLMDKLSLGIELVPETAEDARRAALVEFGTEEALPMTVFPMSNGTRMKDKDGRSLSPRSRLQQELHYNTRAAKDPFNVDAPRAFRAVALPLKRKRPNDSGNLTYTAHRPISKLVDYDSASD